MNLVIMTGRLVKDIELKGSGEKVWARFTLAVDNPNKKDDVSFVSCVAFKKTAEILEKYCSKGSKIGVVGSIKTGSYDKEDGTKVFTTDVMVNKIEFLDSKKDGVAPAKVENAGSDYTEDDFPW